MDAVVASIFIEMAYILLGVGMLFMTWRMTSRLKNLLMRLSISSFVFAALFCSERWGGTYIFIPRTVGVIIEYLDTLEGHSQAFNGGGFEYMLTYCFIPVAITWLASFLAAWIFVSRKKNNQQTAPSDKGGAE